MYCYQIGQKITGNSWSEDDSVSDGGDGASSALHLSCLPSGLQPPRFPRSSRVPTDHLALGGTQTAWWSQTDTFLFFSLLLTLLEIPHWIPIRSDSCPPPWSPPPKQECFVVLKMLQCLLWGERRMQAGKEVKRGVG